MESLRTRQDVNATADVVWSVLVDGAQYCTWVPGVEDVEGDVEDGQAITLLGGNGEHRTHVHVVADANRRVLTWREGAGLGLDSSVHTFDLADTEFGCTIVLTREDSGLLHGLLGRGDGDPKEQLDALAAGLRSAAEARATRRETRGTAAGEDGATLEDPGPETGPEVRSGD